jgi:hypothetical protein
MGIPAEHISSRIFVLREQRIMLDADLAELYGVPTKVLVQAVRRNLDRFPSDFLFRLTQQELGVLRSQTVTSSSVLRSAIRGLILIKMPRAAKR